MEVLQYLQADLLHAFCTELDMPEEVTSQLCSLIDAFKAEADRLEELLPALLDKSRAEAASQQVREIGNLIAPDGLGELALLLTAALAARPIFAERGISDDIFLATMGCFPRFVRESREWTGHWCFDRGFWVWRQISGQLFRIGTLEFELRTLTEEYAAPLGFTPGEPALSVHIPGDAILTTEALHASYAASNEFFMKLQGSVPPAYCHTWLLSRTVHDMLPPSSGICTFARDYTIVQDDASSNSGRVWLFNRKDDVPDEALPENTSLQRAAKKLLLSGGHIGNGLGKLSI
ncbi:acyltransferase domain-containing protein [Paenibacillus dakarensis]|uniref:acyltransferase domain-containing protein n=1 Tax=Paenibacillus dakarensis TaxID=1527293 RepID=UPI0006D57203|nr:acyltransferase domain-containing protein [Paenibacillus dakarensis]